MGINKLLGREKTNPETRGTYSAYVSGTYLLPYGKTTFKISGVGTPGNAATGGNATGSTNPPTGGNTSYNPSTGGNYAGTNPPVVLYTEYFYSSNVINYTNTAPNVPSPSTAYQPSSSGSGFFYNQTSYGRSNNQVNVVTYEITNLESGSSLPAGASFNNTYNGTPGQVSNSTNTWAYNNYSTTPGNANYNPVTPGNAYTNPVHPGNPTYNPIVPGNAGPTNIVLGVPFPGGAAGSPAPTVTPTYVNIFYTPGGTAITVPTGGRVDIINS